MTLLSTFLTVAVAVSCLMAQKKKLLDVCFKLKAVDTAEKRSKEVTAHEIGTDARLGLSLRHKTSSF